jgi:hypothetical protein
MYDGSSRAAIAAFKTVLDAARLPSTVRLTRGRGMRPVGRSRVGRFVRTR